MINEEINTFKKNSFQMEWLSRDYGNGGVVDISMVVAYSGMELCTSILLGESSKTHLDGKSFSKQFKTHNAHIA
jgi:hypothetical protein